MFVEVWQQSSQRCGIEPKIMVRNTVRPEYILSLRFQHFCRWCDGRAESNEGRICQEVSRYLRMPMPIVKIRYLPNIWLKINQQADACLLLPNLRDAIHLIQNTYITNCKNVFYFKTVFLHRRVEILALFDNIIDNSACERSKPMVCRCFAYHRFTSKLTLCLSTG